MESFIARIANEKDILKQLDLIKEFKSSKTNIKKWDTYKEVTEKLKS